MLRIQQAQIEWFARKSQADFIARMAGWLREEHAASIESIRDLEGWLRRVVDRALASDVTNEPEVAQLMLLYMLVGLDSKEHAAWIDPVLRDRKLLAVGKMRKLVAEARTRGVERVDEIDITDTLEDV